MAVYQLQSLSTDSKMGTSTLPLEPTASIVVPVRNGGEKFRQCLLSLKKFTPPDTEIIVVVDGDDDDSWKVSQNFDVKVIRLATCGGPARARNIGARASSGDILIFFDADITINSTTFSQIKTNFQEKPHLAALIGSYDDQPGAANFLSQYKNLFHHYTHQMASPTASTFWGACGAVRRNAFFAVSGFDESYRYPSVEDIDLGYRLKKASYEIQLSKSVQVKHLKHWQGLSLLRAEFFYRALPWTELLWRDRQFANDLNLKSSSRISLVLAYGLLMTLFLSFWQIQILIIATIFSLVLILLNLPVYQFFHQKRGLWFAIRVVPWHWFYFLYGGLAFAVGTLQYFWPTRLRGVESGFSRF